MRSRTNILLKIVFAVWLVLWAVFFVRQDKKGQYQELKFYLSNEYDAKVDYLLGEDLARIVKFCSKNIPEGSSYDIMGFERFSIREVRARYFLWPLRRVHSQPDYIIIYGEGESPPEGYSSIVFFEEIGGVYAREELL